MNKKNKIVKRPLFWLLIIAPLAISCEKELFTVDQPVTDIDGNVYKTVKIGSQIWMAENLKVTRFSDGSPITLTSSGKEWDNISIYTKGYCLNGEYGAYYTWAAANNGALSSSASPSGVQGACPTGWHLPSAEEWMELATFLGGSEVAGGKLKEAGSAHWNDPNIKGTNESGFTALGGGYKSKTSNWPIPLYFRKAYGYWWSSDMGGLGLSFYKGTADIGQGSPSTGGKSVRCLKD